MLQNCFNNNFGYYIFSPDINLQINGLKVTLFMEYIKKFIFTNKFNLVLLLIWLFVVIFISSYHELWRDETQAWCIVRDCSLIDIYNRIRLEGHPVLWYLILLPFAKTGISVISMQVICVFLVFTAVVYFLFKSPVNNFIKTAVVLSSGMIYFLPVIARNYSLIPVLLFILADLYNRRNKNPFQYSVILILLSNTHILMLGFCFILFLLFVFEQIKELKKEIDTKKTSNPISQHGADSLKTPSSQGNDLFCCSSKSPFIIRVILCIMPSIFVMLNFLVLFFMFNNMQNTNHAVAFYTQNTQPLFEAVKNFALLYFLYPLNILNNINIFIFYSTLAGILYFFIKRDKKLFIILLFSILYQFYIYYKIWYQGIVYQKAYLLLLIILFCYWVYGQHARKEKLLSVFVGFLFLTSLISTPFVCFLEYKMPFSSTKQAAEYIKNNLNKEKTFYAVGYPFTFTSISAYLPDKEFYSYMNNYYISYYDFDLSSDKKISNPPDIKYYIVQSDFTMDENIFEEIYTTDNFNISTQEYKEAFKIYVRK